MQYHTDRTVEEIDELYERVSTQSSSKYPGMSYEDGIASVIQFLDGDLELDELYERDKE